MLLHSALTDFQSLREGPEGASWRDFLCEWRSDAHLFAVRCMDWNPQKPVALISATDDHPPLAQPDYQPIALS